jgi:hypothetical protein
MNDWVLFLIGHMLNQGVIQTYLMRNTRRSRIFTGSASMRIRNTCMMDVLQHAHARVDLAIEGVRVISLCMPIHAATK